MLGAKKCVIGARERLTHGQSAEEPPTLQMLKEIHVYEIEDSINYIQETD
jgi:hypothetical protein